MTLRVNKFEAVVTVTTVNSEVSFTRDRDGNIYVAVGSDDGMWKSALVPAKEWEFITRALAPPRKKRKEQK